MKKIVLLLFFLFITFQPTKVFAQKKIPILIYHSIDEFSGHGVEDLYVHPKEFEKQMTYLKEHGFTLLTFEKWRDRHKVKKPIFITFDDGYKNNLIAFSILQKLKDDKFKPTGTIFVISDYIDWSNRLSKADLKKMADSGIFSIQSHTATHPNLTKITNYEYELNESKKKIQAITEKPVIALAYPYSLYNQKVIGETKKYYTYGLTTIPELYVEKGKKDENYLLPRIYIKYSTSLDEFAKIVD